MQLRSRKFTIFFSPYIYKMGLSESKYKLPYLIGVKEKNPPAASDPQVDSRFEEILKNIKLKLAGRNDEKYTEYVKNIRLHTKDKYSEIEEINSAKAVPDDYIRDKIVYAIAAYSQLIDNINFEIRNDCSVEGFCPRHVISEEGDRRPIDSLDIIHPCQMRSCMHEQLESQLAKYKRWVISGKWAGDTTKSKSAPEDVLISRDGLVEILMRLQQSILLNIELATANHSTDISSKSEKEYEDGFVNKLLGISLGWKIMIVVIAIIIVVAVILLIYFRPGSVK